MSFFLTFSISLSATVRYNVLNTVPTCRRNRNRKGEKEGHVSRNPLYFILSSYRRYWSSSISQSFPVFKNKIKNSVYRLGMVRKSFTISENLKSCQGPVLKCRDSRERRALYLNELVILEIRNNASAIFQNFLFSCCKMEFVQCGKNPLKPLPSLGGYLALSLSLSLSLALMHILFQRRHKRRQVLKLLV